VEITSQNHGFASDAASLQGDQVEITSIAPQRRHRGALRHRTNRFWDSVPTRSQPGPHDAITTFGRFRGLDGGASQRLNRQKFA